MGNNVLLLQTPKHISCPRSISFYLEYRIIADSNYELAEMVFKLQHTLLTNDWFTAVQYRGERRRRHVLHDALFETPPLWYGKYQRIFNKRDGDCSITSTELYQFRDTEAALGLCLFMTNHINRHTNNSEDDDTLKRGRCFR